MRTGIKLDMTGYGVKKREGKCCMTETEKIARLYALADVLNVQIGTGRRNNDRDPRFLPEKS